MTATHTLVIERDIRHPVEKVWRALTQAPLIEDWLMKNDFVPVVGHHFKFRAEPYPNWDGIINAEVLDVEPNVKLAYTWESMGLATTVTWTLTPSADGTHLRMEQAGFASDHDNNYKGATWGWTKFISQLESVVAGL